MSKKRFFGNLLLYVVFSQLTGCIGIGKNTIHSPSAIGGMPMKHQHAHGGPTKKSPPEAIIFSDNNDSISVRVSARILKYKPILAGPVIPIFPAFLIPGQKYYKSDPETLEIKMAVSTRKDVVINSDSLYINFNGSNYTPIKSLRKLYNANFQEFEDYSLKTNSEEYYELHYRYSFHEFPDEFKFHFNIDAEDVDNFKLYVDCFAINSKKLIIPEIGFEKKKQTLVFMGP